MAVPLNTVTDPASDEEHLDDMSVGMFRIHHYFVNICPKGSFSFRVFTLR